MFKTPEQTKELRDRDRLRKKCRLPDQKSYFTKGLLFSVMKCRTFYCLDNRVTEMKPVSLQFPFKAKHYIHLLMCNKANMITSAHVTPILFRTKIFRLENVPAGVGESEGNCSLFSLRRKRRHEVLTPTRQTQYSDINSLGFNLKI